MVRLFDGEKKLHFYVLFRLTFTIDILEGFRIIRSVGFQVFFLMLAFGLDTLEENDLVFKTKSFSSVKNKKKP